MRRIALLLLAVSLGCFAGAARAAEITPQKMLLPAHERQVHVTYFRAPGDAQRPAVLVLHGANGFESQIDSYDAYGSELANHGIDAYLVYYYSDADEEKLSNGENVFTARYAAWTRLVADLAADLRQRKESNGKVGLIGFSNGATLSGGVGARDPDIAAAVIYYGTQPFPMDVPVTRFPPLLILHGDADAIIPVENGRALAALAKKLGGTSELVIYPGERHGFGSRLQTANGRDALDRTIAFLRRELDVH
jgi:carboxymethylenebutenolidase